MEFEASYKSRKLPRSFSANPYIRPQEGSIGSPLYGNNEQNINKFNNNNNNNNIQNQKLNIMGPPLSPVMGNMGDFNSPMSAKAGGNHSIGNFNNSPGHFNAQRNPSFSGLKQHPVSATYIRKDMEPIDINMRSMPLTGGWSKNSIHKRRFKSALETTRFPKLSSDPYQQESVIVHILKERTSIDQNILENKASSIRVQNQLKMSGHTDVMPQIDDPIARTLAPNYARKQRAVSATVGMKGSSPKMSNNGYNGYSKFPSLGAKSASNIMEIQNRTSFKNSRPISIPTRNERLRAELASISNVTKQGKTSSETIYATPSMLDLIGKTVNINKMNREQSAGGNLNNDMFNTNVNSNGNIMTRQNNRKMKKSGNGRSKSTGTGNNNNNNGDSSSGITSPAFNNNVSNNSNNNNNNNSRKNDIIDSKALYNKFTKIDTSSLLGARVDREVSVEEILKNGRLAILNEHQKPENASNSIPRRYTQVPKFEVNKIPSIITSELNKNRIIVE